jgi:hypothetical protein
MGSFVPLISLLGMTYFRCSNVTSRSYPDVEITPWPSLQQFASKAKQLEALITEKTNVSKVLKGLLWNIVHEANAKWGR